MTGKEITLEVMEKKPALLAAIEPRKNEEVSDLDNGEIPGDHLGMCIIRHYEKQMKENLPTYSKKGNSGRTKSPSCRRIFSRKHHVKF